VEARKLSTIIKGVCEGTFTDEEQQLVTDLDAFGYDEAAKYVYRMDYDKWKEAHQKKATEKQLALFKASMPIHAKHDKNLLETRCEQGPPSYDAPPDEPTQETTKFTVPESSSLPKMSPRDAPQSKPSILSNVCCEDLDSTSFPRMGQSSLIGTTYKAPPPPRVNLSLKVGILTVSDRAANGQYETGDLSGPAVEQSLNSNINKINAMRNELDETRASVSFCVKAIVPDDVEEIKSHLQQWCGVREGGPVCDIVFTTGGTGFSFRDVTPEATLDVIEKEAPGLMSFVLSQCAATQPLAPLSRGTAGICEETIIVNLPGNPAGVGQVMDILMPLLLYAVKDVKGM
jgi:gephyrin